MVLSYLKAKGNQLLGYPSKTPVTDTSTLTDTFMIQPDTYSLSFNHFVDSNFFILFIKMIKICQLLKDGKIKRINFAQSSQITIVITDIDIDILQSIILTHAIGYLITWNFFSVREQVTADELRQRYAQYIYKEATTEGDSSVNIHKTILDNLKKLGRDTDILGLIELIYISFPVRRRDTELQQIKSQLNSVLEKIGLRSDFKFTSDLFTNFDENYKNGLEKYPHCFDNILYHFILDPNTPPLPRPSFLKGGAGYEEEKEEEPEKMCCFDVNEFKNINIKRFVDYYCQGASRDYVKCEKEALANANDQVANINRFILSRVKEIQPEIEGGSGLSVSSNLAPVPTLASSNLSNNPVINPRAQFKPYQLPQEIQLMDRPGSRQEWNEYFNFDGDTTWGATKQFFGFSTPGSTLPAGEGIAVAEATAGGLGLVGSGIAGIASSAVPLETFFGTTTVAGTLNSAQISAIVNGAFSSNIVQGMALRSGEIIVSGTVTQVTGYATAGSTTAAGTTTLGTVAATAGIAIVVAGTVYSIYGISNIQSTNIKTKEELQRKIVLADIAWSDGLRDLEKTINEAKLADITTTQEAENEFKSTLQGISGLQNQQSETTDETTGKVSRTTFNQEFTPQSVDRDLQTQRNEAEKAAKAEIRKQIFEQEQTLIKIETDIGKLISETSEFEENNINIRNDILKNGLKVPGEQSTFILDYGFDIALGSIAFVTLLTMVTAYFQKNKPVVPKSNVSTNPSNRKKTDPWAGFNESVKNYGQEILKQRESQKANSQKIDATQTTTPVVVGNIQGSRIGGRKTSKKHKKNTRKYKKNVKNTKKCKRLNSTRKM